MPIYEYACDDCQENFEVFTGINDAPVQECTHCAGNNIRKLISNCSFQLKGTGWYKTDYAGKDSGNGNKKAPTEEKSGADTSASASKDSESKKTSKDSDSSSKKSSSEKAA